MQRFTGGFCRDKEGEPNNFRYGEDYSATNE
jgi:hypothetical protein